MTLRHYGTLASYGLLFALTLPLGCSKPPTPAAENTESQMQAGLDALYTRHDPHAAAAAFRKVLAQNPTHYGATYQLAKALDQMQKPAEAEPVWQKVLAMANGYQDAVTADAARTRLGQSQPAQPIDAPMQAGLDALYTRHDPAAAAAIFRQVLEQNPTHYGATYQLATALDAAGKRDEARAVWDRMLPMAEAARDQTVIDTVRTRLTATP